MDRDALTATDVTHAWSPGGAPVLDGVSIALRPGEMVGVLGPNGAGKSTLVKVLGGVLAPTAGRVRLGDAPLDALPARARARRVAYVPQREVLPLDLPVRDYVALGRSPWSGWTGRLNRDDLSAIDAAMDACAIAPHADRALGSLSGGEQRRCITARALAQSAGLILLDEPLASLDAHHQVALCEILRARVEQGVGVLAVFHEINLAAQVCDRVAVLRGGRLIAEGPPRDALTAAQLERVFPCDFLAGETPAGAPYFVPLSGRSAPRGARTPR